MSQSVLGGWEMTLKFSKPVGPMQTLISCLLPREIESSA